MRIKMRGIKTEDHPQVMRGSRYDNTLDQNIILQRFWSAPSLTFVKDFSRVKNILKAQRIIFANCSLQQHYYDTILSTIATKRWLMKIIDSALNAGIFLNFFRCIIKVNHIQQLQSISCCVLKMYYTILRFHLLDILSSTIRQNKIKIKIL